MQKELFDIQGMTCSACSSRVHKTVAALPGVEEVTVNLLKNSMRVSFDSSTVGMADITTAVEKAGYGATPHNAQPVASGGKPGAAMSSAHENSPDPTGDLRQRLYCSLLLTLPLIYVSMGPMASLPMPAALLGTPNALAFAFTQFLLAIPVVYINFRYFRVGCKTLLRGAPTMDSLIAIGSGAAMVFGIYALYKMAFALGAGDMATVKHFAHNLYFESAAMILTLITLGKFFEARAKGKTSEAIAKLLDLAPPTATVLRQGKECTIPRQEVLVGDILVVKAGESIPVDGVITEGTAYVDASALTGESLPVEKNAGEEIIGSTINKAGAFFMRATRVGEDTTLAQIIRLVDEATSSKAPIARLADSISGIFVPVVIGIALLATAVWLLLGYDLEFALSIGICVLVISCPCALGLATPTAIMVGTGRGAAHGILFKSAEAIETAQSIDTVVLDKTGTVTEGKPSLTRIVPTEACNEEDLLRMAASLEKMSEHPLAAAIVHAAEQRGMPLVPVSHFRQIAGQGVQGMVEGQPMLGGNARMLAAEGIDNSLISTGEAEARQGRTVLYFARGGTLLGLVAVADVIKSHSRQAVAELTSMGIQVIMLTGDNAHTAEAVRQQAGIDRVVADVLPQDKEREIRHLQDQGKKVAMVGDGINDAPALVRADVGMAIGAGTDIAIESADVVLMKSDLLDVVTAIQLSKAVMRTIRQNLFWAFFYNSVGIPVAAGLFYSLWGLTLSPMIAAAAMSLSSVSVVSNALRLRLFAPRHHPSTSLWETTRSFTMNKIMDIDGMNCGHCTATVEKALLALPGVQEVQMDLAAKTATLKMETSIDDALLTKTVTDAGFQVRGIRQQ